MKKFLAVALIAVSSAVSAQTSVKFNGWAYGGTGTSGNFSFLNDPRTGNPITGSATGGGFSVILNGSASFAAYCTELFQNFTMGQTYTDYARMNNAPDYKWSSSSPGVNGWNPARSNEINDRLGQLWAYAGTTYGLTGTPGSSTSANQTNSTALQWAIWNVVYDTDNTLSSGNFSMTGDSSVLTTANSMLAQSLNYGFKYDIDVLKASGRQDQLITTGAISPIPEPSTLALFLAGLSCAGFVARRRKITT